MKHHTLLPALTALCMVLALPAMADWSYNSEAGTISDGNWTLKVNRMNDGTYSLGVSNSERAYVAGSGMLDLYNVEAETGIALSYAFNYALDGCMELTEVVLPDTITTIGLSAFQNCSNLVSATLPVNLARIQADGFRNCTALETVTPFLPETITYLGENCFNGTLSLRSPLVVRSTKLTSLPKNCFSNSRSLPSVDLSGSAVVTLPEGTFYANSALTEVILPENLATIGNNCFRSCTSLTNMVPFLPDTVRSIGESSFYGTTNLVGDLKLNCPDLKSVSKTAFYNNVRLTSVDMSGSGITTLYNQVFQNGRGITNVVLSPVLRSIGNGVFQACSSLESVTPFLPKNLTSIGESAFNSCSALGGELELVCEEMTSISKQAFVGVNLTKVTLPVSALTIGDSCFSGIEPGAEVFFLGAAPTRLGANVFNTGATANPCVIYACRTMDQDGWANYTTALTDSDRARESYPGPGTFGVLVNNSYRHWLMSWNSPAASGPFIISIF